MGAYLSINGQYPPCIVTYDFQCVSMLNNTKVFKDYWHDFL